jgi:hypothetical protein
MQGASKDGIYFVTASCKIFELLMIKITGNYSNLGLYLGAAHIKFNTNEKIKKNRL